MQNVSLDYGGLETYRDGFGCLWRNNHERVVYVSYSFRGDNQSGIGLVWGVYQQQCKEIIVKVTRLIFQLKKLLRLHTISNKAKLKQ